MNFGNAEVGTLVGAVSVQNQGMLVLAEPLITTDLLNHGTINCPSVTATDVKNMRAIKCSGEVVASYLSLGPNAVVSAAKVSVTSTVVPADLVQGTRCCSIY